MRFNKSEENAPATEKQLRKLKRLSKLDTSKVCISVRQYNNLVSDHSYGVDIVSQLMSYGAKNANKR